MLACVTAVKAASGVMLKLMGCYLALAVLGLMVLLVLLENVHTSSSSSSSSSSKNEAGGGGRGGTGGGECPSGAADNRTKMSFQVRVLDDGFCATSSVASA